MQLSSFSLKEEAIHMLSSIFYVVSECLPRKWKTWILFPACNDHQAISHFYWSCSNVQKRQKVSQGLKERRQKEFYCRLLSRELESKKFLLLFQGHFMHFICKRLLIKYIISLRSNDSLVPVQKGAEFQARYSQSVSYWLTQGRIFGLSFWAA